MVVRDNSHLETWRLASRRAAPLVRAQIRLRDDDDDDDDVDEPDSDDGLVVVEDDDIPTDHIWVATRPRNRGSSAPETLVNISYQTFRRAHLPLPYVDSEFGPARQRIFWYFENVGENLLDRLGAAMRWLEDFSHWDIDEEDPNLFTFYRNYQGEIVITPLPPARRQRISTSPDGEDNLPTFPDVAP